MKVWFLHLSRVRISAIFLFIAFFLFHNPIFAEDNRLESTLTAQEITLLEAIHRISEQYQVLFNYDRNIVSDIKVQYEPEQFENVDAAIASILKETNLKYQIFRQRYVVLYKNDQEGIESLKEMIQHFQMIVDDREDIVLERQKLKPSPKLVRTLPQDILVDRALSFSIGGTVTDQEGEPLIGVNIQVKGTNMGTSTDIDGQFIIDDIDENAVLVVSYIGYQTLEVAVAGKSNLTIVLLSDSQLLDEVVVVGYGTQRSRDITTAVSKLSKEKLDNRTGAVSRVDQALIGSMPGVRVQEISGQPGRSLSVKVRGTGTITAGSEPLYVVDGIPISGNLDNIAIGNIESIEVLKDAAASAIYGSRGANGVVLITTQSGYIGKPTISVKSRFGYQQVAKTYDVLDRDEWIDFAIEERTNTYLLNGGDPNVSLADLPASSTTINPLWLSNRESIPNTDWQELISQTAPIHNTQFNIAGGTENTQYNVYADVFHQDGVIQYTDYNRYSFRANVDTRVTDFLKFGLNISPSISTQNEADAENVGGPIARATFLAPTVESHIGTVETGFENYTRTDILVNPLAWLKETQDKTRRFRTLGSLYGELDLFKSFTFRNTVSLDYQNSNTNYYQNNNVNRNRGSIGRASTGFSTNLLNESILSYTYSANIHQLNAFAGFSAQKFYSESTSIAKTGFPDDLVKTLNAGTEITSATSSASEHSLLSYFSRLNYSLLDRYLFSASIRRDGSSRFGPNNKWGWFPSASVGWRISEERIMRDFNSINELKLRASYGVTGNNAIPNYGYIGALSQNNYILGAGSGGIITGLSPSSFGNPDLGWEKNTTLNLGVDLGLLQNRYTLGIDIYRSVTNDLLLQVPIPVESGFDSSLENIGKVENKGIEIETGLNLVSTRNFSWKIDGNIAFNKNEVLELGREGAPIPGIARCTTVTITRVGDPIGSYYLIPVLGIFMSEEELANSPVSLTQNVGDLKYKDVNGDGVITGDDREIVGKNQPDYIWGLSQTLRFKNFDLSAMAYGEWGNKLLNESQGGAGRSSVGNVLGYWRDRYVSPENPGDGKTPRAAVTANLTTPSEFWLADAGFWRIRNVSLGYTAPSELLGKWGIGVTGFRVFLSAENIFTQDNYYGSPQAAT
ncbi:MAG TPA: TonB-dependent receptor, partial [Membranihabitans sp.]|nr:TonB-dependent receptor [Membranihabitans sp.]